MAYLEDEPAAERVADIISDAHDDGVPLIMSVVNVGEVWHIIAPHHRRRSRPHNRPAPIDRHKIHQRRLAPYQLAGAFMSVPRAVATGLPRLADCYAAALAISTASGSDRGSSTLITGDHEFQQLEKGITINWL